MLNVEEPVVIYPDTRKALSRLRLRLLCLAPIFLLLFAVMSSPSPSLDGFTNVLRWFLLAELPVLYLVMSKKLSAQKKPIVSLSSQGITVHTVGTPVGFLRWEEIKNVYTYNLGFRFVGITLNDPRAVYRRIGLKRSWLLQMNGAVAPLYNLFGIRVAPINIPQEYLPMSANDLVAQIDAYRSTYS